MIRKPVRLLLLVLSFVAAQAALAAHDLSHSVPDPIQCPLCAGHLQSGCGLAPSPSYSPVVKTAAGVFDAAAIPAAPAPRFHLYRSRAPPASFH